MRVLLATALFAFAASTVFALPEVCNELCSCKTGPIHCARVLSRVGIFQMQYPGCFNTCFSNCCEAQKNSSSIGFLSEIKEGACTDDIFVEVATDSKNGPVGLVEPCPGLYLGAIQKLRSGN
ncbi:Hypothetical predicted protein [Cloeon dipterum]|uniref:Uncharacterized protein n=1 Tax=Cloeon dipterum TaxID=197152 RepID=A0A8S1CXN4_9INSE|nr:Hypothetical predicted protein [Cloeon dipterum]